MTHTAETSTETTDLTALCAGLADRAVAASRALAATTGADRDCALELIADALLAGQTAILDANAKDLAAGESAGLGSALLDRLKLDTVRLAGMADAVRQVAAQPEQSRIMVLISGRCQGSKVSMPAPMTT